jgi:hypothetical protein
MIPIATPKGTFKVWTKRVGNNPKIKVLLLHGMTHWYRFGKAQNQLIWHGIAMSQFLPQSSLAWILKN